MARIPPDSHDSWSSYLISIAPGLLLCLALGALARWMDAVLVPGGLFVVNYVLLAIIMGLIARNLVPLPRVFLPGAEFASRMCLYIGIVLLGAGLDLARIFTIGASAIAMVAISITGCILLCGWLARSIGAGERWGHLVGAGIGVCGVSAIMALAPAIKARRREIVTAIGAALLTDVLVLIALPAAGRPLGWSDALAGYIAGVVPSNTAQCIAIGHAYSEAAGAVATIVKSARNALMPVVILAVTYAYTRRGLPVGERARPALLWSRFPKFVLGLLLAAALSTLGLLTPAAMSASGTLSTWFFVVCFAGIGIGMDVREMGGQDLTVVGFGILMTLVLGIYAYGFSLLVLSL